MADTKSVMPRLADGMGENEASINGACFQKEGVVVSRCGLAVKHLEIASSRL